MADSPAAPPPAEPVRAEKSGFGGKQVLAIVGITYRQLDHWARTDLLRPSLCDAKGSGSRRRYSYDDVVQLKVIKKLLDGGQSLQAARKVIERLRVEGEDVGSAQLVIAGDSVALARDREELVDLLRGGQGVLSIFLEVAGVRKEVDAAIDSLLQLDAADGQAAAGQDEAASLAAG
jgi:DNA-binding transcriptional MerR regulator